MPKITVDGAEEGKRLKASFERKGLDVEGNLEQTLEHQAKRVEADAVLLAPVDTGRLKNSIGTRKADEMDFQVGSDVEYAPDQEFGSMRNAPQPYLRPALEKNKGAIKKAIVDAIKAGMR